MAPGHPSRSSQMKMQILRSAMMSFKCVTQTGLTMSRCTSTLHTRNSTRSHRRRHRSRFLYICRYIYKHYAAQRPIPTAGASIVIVACDLSGTVIAQRGLPFVRVTCLRPLMRRARAADEPVASSCTTLRLRDSRPRKPNSLGAW